MPNPRLISLLVASIALATLGCGGTKSPEDVVKEATYAIRDSDLDALERLMAPNDFDAMLQAAGGNREQLAQMIRQSQQQVQLEDLSVLSTKIEGDTATVEVELVTGQGRIRSPTYLRKIRGEWRVTSSPASRGARRGRR